MPQLLIELFSEEIPARMQKRAEEDLLKLVREKLAAEGLGFEKADTFSGPRRLGLVIDELPAKAEDVNEEKKGPRVGAPEQALQGFLRSAGLSSIEEAEIVEDKKGAFYVARIARAGRTTPAILQDALPQVIRAFPWPKSMRSGESDLQWVRPLHNVLCLFDGAPVKIEVDGVASKPETWGHRFHAPGVIKPKDAADHAAKLRAAKVLLDREERKHIILEQARKLCAAKKLELVEDAGLLEEVAGLAEWPVVLLGDMSADFLDLPQEVIRLSMRTHQKYFAVRNPKTKQLAPHFVVVANVEAKDGGKAIAAGNARVLSARLNDARFFWDADKKTPLFTEERKAKLEKIVFHQKLGSVWDKVERVKALAKELAPVVWTASASASPHPLTPSPSRGGGFETLERFIAAVERAAELCKMDLVTETVGEFPELQGQVGRALAELGSGPSRTTSSRASASPHPLTPSPSRGGGAEHPSVCAAIEDHYRPLGPNDRVPSDPVAVTLALADKLDTLVGFWAIDEKPTGSSDPYALRRAALGFIRLMTLAHIRLRLTPASSDHLTRVVRDAVRAELVNCVIERNEAGRDDLVSGAPIAIGLAPSEMEFSVLEHAEGLANDAEYARVFAIMWARSLIPDLLSFLADRLKVQLREQGKRHDLVDAVFALGDDDLVRIVARVEALDQFLKTEDGGNLLAGYRRAANILAAEEKKGKGLSEADLAAGLDASRLVEPAEKALHAALEAAIPKARAGVESEDFAASMQALSRLRAPVDAFFDAVLVNAEDALLRRNRLLLLSKLREALSAVADFSKIEG